MPWEGMAHARSRQGSTSGSAGASPSLDRPMTPSWNGLREDEERRNERQRNLIPPSLLRVLRGLGVLANPSVPPAPVEGGRPAPARMPWGRGGHEAHEAPWGRGGTTDHKKLQATTHNGRCPAIRVHRCSSVVPPPHPRSRSRTRSRSIVGGPAVRWLGDSAPAWGASPWPRRGTGAYCLSAA